MASARRAAFSSALGGSVGVVMGALALWCTAFGHGTYIPAALSASPLSLCGTAAALLGAPAVWGAIALVAGGVPARRNAAVFLAMMVSHYVVAIAVISFTDLGDWSYVGKTWHAVPGIVIAWAFVYCAANATAWAVFLATRKAASRQPIW